MNSTVMCLSLLRQFARRAILEDTACVPRLQELIRRVRIAEAEAAWDEMDKLGVKLRGVVDWQDIGF